jgi:hypothetical protein
MRDLICKRCLTKVGEEQSVKATKPKKVKLCQDCKSKSLEEHKKVLIERNKSVEMSKSVSERMKLNNPMLNEETRAKVSETMKKEYELGNIVSTFSDPEKLKQIKAKWKLSDGGREAISKRMTDSNPMRDEKSKAKMVATFKNKIESGEIVYKNGIEHHLWKGNRGFKESK